MASVSVVPALIDALVAQATAAVGLTGAEATVYDGVGNADIAGDYLMIGVDDPDGPDWARSASVTRDFETVGGGAYNDIDEEGDIACVALSWNGSTDQKSVRDAVYAIAEALAGVCRTNPTLGIDRLLWALYGGRSDLLQVQNENGVLARLEFQIHFRALI